MKNKTKNAFGLKAKLLHGSNWIITIIAVVAAVVVVNILVGLLTDKFQIKLDLTPNRIIGITDTTKDVLNALDKDVDIVVFEDKNSQYPYINEILDKYEAESSHISIVKVDVVSDPAAVKKYELSADDIMSNSIIVECGNKYKLIQPFDIFPPDSDGNFGATINAEGVLTSAITFVTDEVNTKIGVIEGHGEFEFLNSNMGYTLKQQYIDYEYINLYTQDIPEDVTYLVICGPEKDYTDEEIDKLDAYLSGGKSLQLMLSATAPVLPNLEGYLSEWGLKVNNDTIKENNPNYIYNSNNSLVWVVGDTHDITSGLSQIIIPYPKSIDVERNVNLDGLTLSSIFTTSKKATSISNATGEETDGEYSLSILVENASTKSSILVISSASVYSDTYFKYNAELFTNAMSYQTGKNQVTLIKPKSLVPASLDMSATDVQLVGIVVVFVIPFAILIWGFIVWLRRRHL